MPSHNSASSASIGRSSPAVTYAGVAKVTVRERTRSPFAVSTKNVLEGVSKATHRTGALSRTLGRYRAQQRANHLTQSTRQRSKCAIGVCAGTPASTEGPKHTSMTPLGVDEPRKQRLNGKPVDVAGVNASQKRLCQVGRGFLTESPVDEGANRFIITIAARLHEEFPGHAKLARPGKQASGKKRSEAGRNSEHRCVRQGVQSAPALDVGQPGLLRGDQVVFQPPALRTAGCRRAFARAAHRVLRRWCIRRCPR